MTELEKYIQSYFGIPREDLEKISDFFKPVSLKKGDYFLKKDQMCTRLGFVQSGILREFVQIGEKEITKWISTKGYFTGDISGYMFRQPSRWNIQTITDCELFVITKEDYDRIGSLVRGWNDLEKMFLVRCFSILEERVVSFLAMSAEERYLQLFANNKDLFNQVPLQFIASTLGMTPETLSRLRKKALL